MTRQEAEQTVALLKATGVFTKVREEAPYPFVNFTVWAKIENPRSGNTWMKEFPQPLDEAAAKKAAKAAKKAATEEDKRIFANWRADRENQR